MIVSVLFAILVILDIVSTKKALARPGTKEGNPIIRLMMTLPGNTWVAVKLIVSAVVIWLLHDEPPIILGALCVIYAYVVYNNLKHAKN